MKKAIFSSFNFAPSFITPVLHVIQTEMDNGHDVFYVTCLGSFSSCGFNLHRFKYMCAICKDRFKSAQPYISGKLKVVELQSFITNEDRVKAEIFITNKVVDKDLWYGAYDVGESVMSSYISKTRDRDMELQFDSMLLKQLAEQSITVYDAVSRFLKEQSIDEILIFNGRWDYYRAAFRAANELGVLCQVFENLRPGGIIEFYGNNFPHIIKNKQAKYDELWDRFTDIDYKQKLAGEYFHRKRDGQVVVGKSFTKDQTRMLLPQEVQGHAEVLVLFNSSDDEFAAVAGDEYKNPYFKTQTEGILYVADLVGKEFPNKLLVIRMHPNLAGLKFGYVKTLYNLKGKYKNVVFIEPESKIDSYALIEAAEKVITFGSSIGVEANYWRKPVILLGKPFYFYANVAYLPGSVTQIAELIASKLELKPQEGSEKIGFYAMAGGVKAKYYRNKFKREYFFKDHHVDKMPFSLKIYYKFLKLFKVKN